MEAFARADGRYISGQELADFTGCSRTAIWKHIEDLRKEGYTVEAVRNKGYRITAAPEKVTPDEIFLTLNTAGLGRNIHYEESVPSTQPIARRLAGEGAPEGTLVTAEEQTAGKGRLSRSWHSPKYSGIWMSLILRPEIPFQNAPQLTLVAAAAIARAVEKETGIKPEIKWPNDLLINRKKITGILTELQAESDRIHSVIIGVGMNVNQDPEDFPAELKEIATSLSAESGKKFNRARIISGILFEFEALYEQFLKEGFLPVKQIWESYAVSLGKEIKATLVNGVICGRAAGITDEGVLLLEDHDGKIHSIYSADIELPKAES